MLLKSLPLLRQASRLMAVTVFAAALLNERLAVNALTYGGVCFVSCDLNSVESAEIFVSAMVFALLYGAFNRGIGGLVIHFLNLFI